MSIAERITITDNVEPYQATLTEDTFLATLETFRNAPPRSSGKPLPVYITRWSHVFVGRDGHVTVIGSIGSNTCTKEQFKEAFGVDLGEKNDYVTTLGKLLPEGFWKKGKEHDNR